MNDIELAQAIRKGSELVTEDKGTFLADENTSFLHRWFGIGEYQLKGCAIGMALVGLYGPREGLKKANTFTQTDFRGQGREHPSFRKYARLLEITYERARAISERHTYGYRALRIAAELEEGSFQYSN